ncbi:MAG: aldehyde-activating protein [Pseudomonadota bacterium]
MSGADRHAGSCHCGSVTLCFHSPTMLAELQLRRCACSFCRSHGARTLADPAGMLEILAAPGGLTRYRFGLGTADFLLCPRCGVYLAAFIDVEGKGFATLNANVLEARDRLDPAPPLVHYDGETAADRIARRRARWTPTTLREPDG